MSSTHLVRMRPWINTSRGSLVCPSGTYAFNNPFHLQDLVRITGGELQRLRPLICMVSPTSEQSGLAEIVQIK